MLAMLTAGSSSRQKGTPNAILMYIRTYTYIHQNVRQGKVPPRRIQPAGRAGITAASGKHPGERVTSEEGMSYSWHARVVPGCRRHFCFLFLLLFFFFPLDRSWRMIAVLRSGVRSGDSFGSAESRVALPV